MSKRKKQAKTLKILLAVALVLLVLELCWLIFAVLGSDKPTDDDFSATEETTLQEQTLPTEPSAVEETYAFPWEEPGAKQPEDYSWEEYQMLTGDLQEAFRNYLGEGFALWQEVAQEQAQAQPWEEPGAKQPEDYSWEEFETLTGAQQIAFQNYLGQTAFENWMNRVQNQAEKNPWEEPGAKQPRDYTLAEYEALSGAQQMAFQQYLGLEGFESWLNKVEDKPAENPWEKPGAKQPEDYSWAEFEALTGAQQMVFQNYLGEAGFETWLNRVQNQAVNNPWENPGAKQPGDYTWAEFEALTGAQQIAFQNHLGEAGFESWLNRVNP